MFLPNVIYYRFVIQLTLPLTVGKFLFCHLVCIVYYFCYCDVCCISANHLRR